MSEGCFEIEDLERALELPADHPRRRHLEECARCRSLADMLRDFATEAVAPVESGFAAVDASLRAEIAEITGVPEALAEVEPAPRAAEVPAAPSRKPWWSFGAPRPALAFAALLVVASAGVALWRANAPAPVLRDASGTGAGAFATLPAKAIAGGLELTWFSEPGADAYRVVFLDGSLRDVARTAPSADTSFVLAPASLPDGLVHGAEVAWQVEALAGGDVVATTSARPLRVP